MDGRRNTNQTKVEAVRGVRGGNLDTRGRNVGSKGSGDFQRMEREMPGNHYGMGNFRRVQEAHIRSGQKATCSEAEMGWPGAPRRLEPKSGQTGFAGTCSKSKLRGMISNRWNWVKELKEHKELQVAKVAGRNNNYMADILTKCLL